MSNVALFRWVNLAAVLVGLWPLSFEPVSTSMGTPKFMISSAMCIMQWNLVIFSPIPVLRVITFLMRYIIYRCFCFDLMTCTFFISSLFSHSSHSSIVSSIIVQSVMLVGVNFFSVAPFFFCSLSKSCFPFSERNTNSSKRRMPVNSFAVFLPILMPVPNLVLGLLRLLCRLSKAPISEARDSMSGSCLESPTW